MSCRRLGEAWSLPAIAAPALAFSARWHGAEKLSKSGHRFRQQAVCISVGSTRLLAQPPIGSPMHAPRLLRKRFQRVVAPAEPHLDLLRSPHCPSYGNLLLARVHQPQAVPAGEQVACPVKLCNAPATKFPATAQVRLIRAMVAATGRCRTDRPSVRPDDPRAAIDSAAGRSPPPRSSGRIAPAP